MTWWELARAAREVGEFRREEMLMENQDSQ